MQVWHTNGRSRSSRDGNPATRRPAGVDAGRRARVAGLLLGLLGAIAPRAHALDPVDPDATPEARALLGYLADLPNRSVNRVLSGQTIHSDLEAQFGTYVRGFEAATGERPAVLQLVLYGDWLKDRDRPIAHRTDGVVFPLGYNHANRGGQVMWVYRPNNPFTGEGQGTLIPEGRSLAEVSTPGTGANAVWEEDLRMLALQAARLDAAGIPVTVCMFGGYNAKTPSWYGVRSNPGSKWSDFRTAWRVGVRTVREAGAHNVLWCLEEANGAAKFLRRGWQEGWIDIQSIQAAHDHQTTGPLDLYTAHVASSSKPILYGQFLLTPELRSSPPSYRYDHAIDLVRSAMPRISAIVPWSNAEGGGPAAKKDHSPVFHLNAAGYAADAWMAHQGELDVNFGKPARAKLPVARDPIAMSGAQTENFDGVGGFAWQPGGNGSLRATAGGDGILDVFYFGPDPVLKRNGQTMSPRFDRLRIRLRNNSLAERIELSWRRTTDAGWNDARTVSIPVRPMGLYLEEYAADLSKHPKWNGTIQQLRLNLNPDHRFGSAEIDYITFDAGGGGAPAQLVNGAFEKSLGVGWTLRDVAAPTAGLARYTADRRSGAHSLLMFMRDDAGDGVAQDVTGVLAAGGPGVYRFGAHFRLPRSVGPRREAAVRALLVVKAGGETVAYRVDGVATRNEWTALDGRADVAWDGPLKRATLILRTAGTREDILVDDAFLELANRPPVLEPVGDRVAEARETLRIEVAASDADGPAPLRLTAAPLPRGASFNDRGNGSGVFEWTPEDEDVSADPYAVTFSAIDQGGAGLATRETIGITVTESPWAGDLRVSVGNPGVVTHRLDAAGSADWKHFGRDTVDSVNRKAGVVDAIGGYSKVGTQTVSRYSGSSTTRPSFAWSGGDPTAVEDGTPAGLYFSGAGKGYALTLPADEQPRTLRVYLGGYNSRGRLEATLSDGSGPPRSTTIGGEGVYDRVATFVYRAAAPNQTLDLRYVVDEDLGGGNVTLAAVALSAPIRLPFANDFEDGREDRWSVALDDTASATSWFVSDGMMRHGARVDYQPSFEETYHLGTYRYLVGGEELRDYRARVTVGSASDSVIDDIGLMFRYQDPDNYYRLSQSARHGYTRLEKRENGIFSTLGVTAIGYDPGIPTTYEVEAAGTDLLVSIDGELVFAVSDGAHRRGTIALYAQDAAWFDDVAVTAPSADPRIAIRRPLGGQVLPGDRLAVEVTALRAPPGSEVVIEVDGYAPRRYADPPYVLNLSGVPAGEYGVTARLLEGPGGNTLSVQTNAAVAVGGSYALAVGDSNTNGLGDGFVRDNRLASRTRSNQGYAATLTSQLDASVSRPHIVFNEGVSGDTTADTRFTRLGSLMERHPGAAQALVALGTNDISGDRRSGEECGARDEACLQDTIRGDLQAIVDELRGQGMEVWTATVPPAWSNGTPSPNTARMLLTREVNRAIRNGITGDRNGPDLFGFFYADTNGDGVPDLPRLSLFADRFHFNGLGHHIVAQLWHNALVGASSGTSIAPFVLSEPSVPGYQQNLLDPSDRIRIDSAATLESFSGFLADAIWVITAAADADNSDGNFLSFAVADRAVDVYVAYDAGATGLPAWLDPDRSAFTAVTGQVVTSEGAFRLYRRTYAAAEPVVLGGNRAAGARNAARMYVPIVVDRGAP